MLRERVYCNCLDYFCRDRQVPTQELEQLHEDLVTLIRFWQVSKIPLIPRVLISSGWWHLWNRFFQVMHSDKKYLVMAGTESEFEMLTPQSYSTCGFGHSETINSLSTALGTTNTEFTKTSSSVWINTVPMSTSSNTLGKRSNRSKRVMNASVFVKDYIKKRNLILELLAVEIEMLLVRLTFTSEGASMHDLLISLNIFEITGLEES